MTAYPQVQLLIDGRWRDAEGARRIPVINPATGEELVHVAHASRADLDEALAAARGFEIWRETAPFERAKLMRRAAGLLRALRKSPR